MSEAYEAAVEIREALGLLTEKIDTATLVIAAVLLKRDGESYERAVEHALKFLAAAKKVDTHE